MTTGLGDGCEALAQQEACEQDPACMAMIGEALDFPGCAPGPTFLACIPAMPCDLVQLDVCQEEPGQEAYRLPNGCVPPGFMACVADALSTCGSADCVELDARGCLAAPDCRAIKGAAHMEVDGEICVDFGAQQFLACVEGEVACPPSIATVCPEGQPDMVFDTPSGCIPPGFMACGAPAQECP